MSSRQPERPRVLVVESDPDLALALLDECVQLGLEPKLCRGPDNSSDCPGLHGEACPRAASVEASLISITSGTTRVAAPACIGGRVVVAGSRPLVGSATLGALGADVHLDHPYEPRVAAKLLFAQVLDARRERILKR